MTPRFCVRAVGMGSRIAGGAARSLRGTHVLALLLGLAGCGTDGPGVDETAGSSAGSSFLTEERLDSIRAPLEAAVAQGAFPGASVAAGVRASEFHLLSAGAIGWTRNAVPVDPRLTRYDLASVTKLVATASAVMLLVEDGKLQLDDPVARFLPEFSEGPKARVTIRHLLTHTSGLPAGATLERGSTRAERIARAKRFSIFPPAGARVEYSDVGYILLWEAAEVAAGEPLTDFLRRRMYEPLGMTSTGFAPGLACEECAPTGRLRDQSLYRGRPFDPLGQRLDGVAGSTGLFSTAYDLGRFAAMVANGGELDGVRIFSKEVAEAFLAEQPVGDRFRLGWEVLCAAEAVGEDGCAGPVVLGHLGWTGTAIYLNPRTGRWLVLLTNRTYEPRGPNRIQEVRRALLQVAIGDDSGSTVIGGPTE